jgi:hypothetical protein
MILVPNIILGRPVIRNPPVDRQLTNQFTKYFGTVYTEREYTGAELRARVDFHTLVSYGRFRLADDGDRIRTAGVIERALLTEVGARDNLFVKVSTFCRPHHRSLITHLY